MVTQKSSQLFEQVFEGLSAKEILDLIPARIFFKDKEGVYFGANKAAKEFSQVELEGKTDYEMSWKESADAFRQNDLLVMENKEAQTFMETVIIDNKSTTCSIVKSPLYDKNGTLIGTIGIPNDISNM